MNLISWTVTFIGALAPNLAFAGQPVRSPNVPACVFDNVLAFGASVTYATPAVFTPYENGIRAVESFNTVFRNYSLPDGFDPQNQRAYGLSPVRYLVKHYRGKEGLQHITYIAEKITTNDEQAGSGQILEFLHGANRPLFDAATVIVGMDAFYWDAVYDNCESNALDLQGRIIELIETARAKNKILILGNVPEEDRFSVRIDSDRTKVNGWWPPDPTCARNISSLLESRCKVDQGCYIVDLRGTTAKLNNKEKLPLRDGGRYGLYEMRPDGVHLSDKGTRYLAELAERELEKRKITCAP